MHKTATLLLFLSLSICVFGNSKDTTSNTYFLKSGWGSNNYETTSLGAGVGLDYGLFGINLTTYPQKNFGVFVGAGYSGGISGNLGIKGRAIIDAGKISFKPFAMAMFGHNAVVVSSSNFGGSYRQAFLGPSFGGGIDVGFFSSKVNLSGGAILPVRSEEANKAGTYYPVLLTLGLKFRLDK